MIAGVVVLYNPDSIVEKNIRSYLNQLVHLYIVDNSEQPDKTLSKIFSDTQKAEYIFNNRNLGMASALNIAVDRALKDGYSFLLTMDQDSYFEEGSLEILIENLSDANYVGIFSPFHKNKFFTNPPKLKGREEVSDIMTSGNVLNLSAVEKAGKFKEDYFIDYVDIEYCLRLRKYGYKIIRVNDSILVHNEANLSKRKIFGLTFYPQNHSAFRWYYKVRNFLYLKKEYYNSFSDYLEVEKKNIRNNIIKVLLFEKDKFKKLYMILKGYIHFHKHLTGKMPS
jgi:rhamnosyltransferase